ncbi:SRPBCC domain-containing protein [Homoserinimonas sp. OAct 916]|uniref:SRPBCC domain-containing protein n=1 Tax=Homoserinimonas sp. OAct 916 TaxID=2211450 RepID=UPI000DBE35AC|nr:SRPBCC domain-containing protein [Homoserinimonas sp. OAct 916]
MVNVNAQIDAVERGLETRDVDGVRSYVQTLSQTYPSPIEDVWDAVTSADRIPRWFLPITGDLRVGGTYQFEGNAGGEIRHCVPPSGGSAEYSVTWGMGQGEPAIVHIRLTAVDATSTRFELENVAAVDSIPEGFWEQFGPSATGMGWDSGLLGLAQYYAGGQDGITPEMAEAWVASPEGKAFMRASADAWADVHERSGADPAVAKAAANTTYGMYTGEIAPPPM